MLGGVPIVPEILVMGQSMWLLLGAEKKKKKNPLVMQRAPT
jgi:hypothetical protein